MQDKGKLIGFLKKKSKLPNESTTPMGDALKKRQAKLNEMKMDRDNGPTL